MIIKLLILLTLLFSFFPAPVKAQDQCQTEINLRLSDLASLGTEVPESLQPRIDSLITDLKNNQSNCSSKKIREDFKIYAFQLPHLRLLAGADMLQNTAIRLDTLASSLSPLTSSKLLDNMKAKTRDVKTQSATIVTTISSLTPVSDQQSVKAAFKTAHAALKQGIIDVSSALEDAKKIWFELQTLKATPSS